MAKLGLRAEKVERQLSFKVPAGKGLFPVVGFGWVRSPAACGLEGVDWNWNPGKNSGASQIVCGGGLSWLGEMCKQELDVFSE